MQRKCRNLQKTLIYLLFQIIPKLGIYTSTVLTSFFKTVRRMLNPKYGIRLYQVVSQFVQLRVQPSVPPLRSSTEPD